MTRLGPLILCFSLGAGLLACGSNASSAAPQGLAAMPLSNDVSGWTVDRSSTKTANVRALTATTESGVENIIDGAATPFFEAGYTPNLFALQYYVNSSLPSAPPDPAQGNPEGASIILYVMEYASAADASGEYAATLQKYPSQYGTASDWQDPVTSGLGQDSRIKDTNTSWEINFHQDAYYVELQLSPSFGPAPDYTPSNPDNKSAAITFAQWVASKL